MRSSTRPARAGARDVALQNLPNGGGQFIAGRCLQQEAGSPGAQGDGGQIRIVVHRQHDDFAVNTLDFQVAQHIEAAEPGHREVGDDHVGSKPLGRLDEEVSVADRADDVEIVLSEQSGQALRDEHVVVGEKDGVAMHRLLEAHHEDTTTWPFLGFLAVVTPTTDCTVGSGENVAARLQEYVDLGIDTFILSGYPHLEEAQRFGKYVMPHFAGKAAAPVAATA